MLASYEGHEFVSDAHNALDRDQRRGDRVDVVARDLASLLFFAALVKCKKFVVYRLPLLIPLRQIHGQGFRY